MLTKTVQMTRPTVIILSQFLILMTYSLITVEGGSGTPREFRSKFVIQCNTFQNKHHITPRKNCENLLDTFTKSISGKGQCNVNPEYYDGFFREASHTASIHDKSLFWANLDRSFVYKFSDTQPGKYVTSIDLLAGYTLNGLGVWCWSNNSKYFDYDSCPPNNIGCEDDKNSAYQSFWEKNSKNFVGLSTGSVFAMLSGSVDGGAFTSKSLFFTEEVPKMKSTEIKKMNVILVHNPEKSFYESCHNGTLKQLEEAMKESKIEYSCVEDPPEVRKLQCEIHPEYRKTGYCPTSGDRSIHHNTITMLMSSAIGFLVLFKGNY